MLSLMFMAGVSYGNVRCCCLVQYPCIACSVLVNWLAVVWF